MSFHVLILAGGEGSRLWPLSQSHFPKQFLKLRHANSFFQESIARFAMRNDLSLHVLTQQEFISHIQEDLKGITQNISLLAEPCRRNTLSAICYALRHIPMQEDEYFLCTPSDHVLENPQELLQLCDSYLNEPLHNKIVTFGITPKKPDTGYGYIKLGKAITPTCYHVETFIEKPPQSLAERFLSQGNYLWNTGIFLIQKQHFLSLLQAHAPEHFSYVIDQTQDFSVLPNVSIDCGILEKTKEITAFQLNQEWLDVGSWSRIYEMYDKDKQENVIIGDVHTLDTTNSLIIGDKKVIATIGLDDMFIIDTPHGIVIGKKEQAEKVKHLLAKMSEQDAK